MSLEHVLDKFCCDWLIIIVTKFMNIISFIKKPSYRYPEWASLSSFRESYVFHLNSFTLAWIIVQSLREIMAAVQLLLPNASNIFASNATNERSTSATNTSMLCKWTALNCLTSVVVDDDWWHGSRYCVCCKDFPGIVCLHL